MINELYEAAQAMQQYHISGDIYAQNYNEVSFKECVRVCISGGNISELSSVTREQKTNMRNYTDTSNGGFPCVKLAPLYRITDIATIQVIKKVKKNPELLDDAKLLLLRDGAVPANNNWDNSFEGKYEKVYRLASKIREKLFGCPCDAFEILWEEFDAMRDMRAFHAALTEAAFDALSAGTEVPLMLKLLFFCRGEDDNAEEDNDDKKKEEKKIGEISVLFDAEGLYRLGMPVTSGKFTEQLNEALLMAEQQKAESDAAETMDAFGRPYSPSKDVMPNVKIGAGFYVKIRTMNEDIPCLHKYKQEGNWTYLASYCSKLDLQRALNCIAGIENEGKTWTCIDTIKGRPRDVLFAYPLRLNRVPEAFAEGFGGIAGSTASTSFSERAKKLIDELKCSRDSDEDSKAANIRIFILRRLNVDNNSGRTKVLYTRQTDANELEKCSEAWTQGCANLPAFPFGAPQTPYPLDAADILNRLWKQEKGKIVTVAFKRYPKYHGLELLMEPHLPVSSDLHRLTESAMTIGPLLVNLCAKKEPHNPIWEQIKDMLAMLGLFLSRGHIGKDLYMENLPYLYGQLLKAADELHALYCKVVRGGDVPPQLVGSSLFQSAAEAPMRTMQMLGQRMMPYYSWAKSYRLKDVKEHDKESRRAGWLYGLCEKIMVQIQDSWTAQTRFNDAEKAQLFIGYLAEFPKKEQTEQNIEEVAAHE